MCDDRGRYACRCWVGAYGEPDEFGMTARFLFMLQTKPEFRERGYARRVVQMAVEHYSRRETRLYLCPEPFDDEPMSAGQLEEFYKSLGFRRSELYDRLLVYGPDEPTQAE